MPLATPNHLAKVRSAAWKHRRAELLREACTMVAELTATGAPKMQTLKTVARKFRGRSLGQGRQLNLSAKSLERIYYHHLRRGESAFVLRNVAGRKIQLDPLFLRLVVQSCLQEHKSVSALLIELDPGNRPGNASLATLHRALPAGEICCFLRAERSLLRQRVTLEKKIVALNAGLEALRTEAERRLLFAGGSK